MRQTFIPIPATRQPTTARWGRTNELETASMRVAGLVLRSRIASTRMGHRWLANAGPDAPVKVVYLVEGSSEGLAEQLCKRLAQISAARIPHALPIEAIEAAHGGRFWIVCPHTGSADGLLTLGRLVSSKDEGRMEPDEARRTTLQLLLALDHAHMHRIPHGPVVMDEVLVDRRGSVLVELMGVKASIRADVTPDIREELESVARCAFEMLTGVQAKGDESIRAAPGLSRSWRTWLSRGLGQRGGFNSAAEALATLPSAW